jgi:hypothetical protein
MMMIFKTMHIIFILMTLFFLLEGIYWLKKWNLEEIKTSLPLVAMSFFGTLLTGWLL